MRWDEFNANFDHNSVDEPGTVYGRASASLCTGVGSPNRLHWFGFGRIQPDGCRSDRNRLLVLCSLCQRLRTLSPDGKREAALGKCDRSLGRRLRFRRFGSRLRRQMVVRVRGRRRRDSAVRDRDGKRQRVEVGGHGGAGGGGEVGEKPLAEADIHPGGGEEKGGRFLGAGRVPGLELLQVL